MLMAAPRADRKMNAFVLASVLTGLHHSSSVSIETGSHTFALLPSVFVSTSMPSVMLASIRRLFCALRECDGGQRKNSSRERSAEKNHVLS